MFLYLQKLSHQYQVILNILFAHLLMSFHLLLYLVFCFFLLVFLLPLSILHTYLPIFFFPLLKFQLLQFVRHLFPFYGIFLSLQLYIYIFLSYQKNIFLIFLMFLYLVFVFSVLALENNCLKHLLLHLNILCYFLRLVHYDMLHSLASLLRKL